MNKTLKKNVRLFWSMSYRHQARFIVNFILCGIAKAAIKYVPLKYLSRYFGEFNQTTIVSTLISKQQAQLAYKIGNGVKHAAKHTPWDSSCLTQAMVGKFWCRLYKIPYVLFIGVAKSPDTANGYKAHAWLTAGPVAITGGNGLIEFSVISSYMPKRAATCVY